MKPHHQQQIVLPGYFAVVFVRLVSLAFRRSCVRPNAATACIPDDIQQILNWLKKQPHIKARTDPQWLLTFLRGSKYSLEKTKQKLDSFYMCRTLIPECFSDRDPFSPGIQRFLKLGLFIPLLNPENPSGPIILFVRNCVYDFSKDSAEDIPKILFMVIEILMIENDNFVVAGHTTVLDAKDTTLSHYAMPATVIEKACTMYQKIFPLRIKGFYYINSHRLIEKCFDVLKPFMNEKFRSRVKKFTDANIDEFYAEYSQKILPNEYGGQAGPVADLIDFWKKKVESYASWFKDDAKYCTNEQMRPGKPKTVFDVFGVEGSFRSLNVD